MNTTQTLQDITDAKNSKEYHEIACELSKNCYVLLAGGYIGTDYYVMYYDNCMLGRVQSVDISISMEGTSAIIKKYKTCEIGFTAKDKDGNRIMETINAEKLIII